MTKTQVKSRPTHDNLTGRRERSVFLLRVDGSWRREALADQRFEHLHRLLVQPILVRRWPLLHAVLDLQQRTSRGMQSKRQELTLFSPKIASWRTRTS